MTNEIIDVEIEEERTMPTKTMTCPHCDEPMKNERGLAIHIGRIHKDVTGSGKTTKKKTAPKATKSKTNGAETVKSIEVNFDKINITTENGGKTTYKIEPPTLLHILASAKAASKEYVESL